jgi:uncharacterized protein YjdB
MIPKSILALMLSLVALPMIGQDYMNIYFKNGECHKVYLSGVLEISTSQYDEFGEIHENNYYQHIVTPQNDYVFDLNDIDSLTFKKFDEEKTKEDFSKAISGTITSLSECETIEDAEKVIDQIKAIEGVEDVWRDGLELFIKIDDWETISFLFDDFDETSEDYSTKLVASLRSYRKEANGNTCSNDNDISSDIISSVTTTKYLNKNGHRPKIVVANQQHFDESRSWFISNKYHPLLEDFSAFGFDTLYLDRPTLDFFASDMYKFDVVLLLTHGNYSGKGHTLVSAEEFGRVLNTGEDITDETLREWYYAFKEWNEKTVYKGSGAIYCSCNEEVKDRKKYWVAHPGITESFFDLPENGGLSKGTFHQGAILFNISCKSMMGNDVDRNSWHSFADKFVNIHGLSLYIGYNESDFYGNKAGPDLFSAMLQGISVSKAYDGLDPLYKYEEDQDGAELKFWPEDNIGLFLMPTFTNQTEAEIISNDQKVEVSGQATFLNPDMIPDYITMGFEYSTDKDLLGGGFFTTEVEVSPIPESMDNGNVLFKGTLSDVEFGNTYYYRAYTSDGQYINYGKIKSFTLYRDLCLSVSGPFYLEIGQDSVVYITSGNGDYEIENNKDKAVEIIRNEVDSFTLKAISDREGPATITVTDKKTGQKITFYVIVRDYSPGKAIDLGLPSGTLWANYNVGAHNPEDYGDYFAWGETVPKDDYSWSTYKWCNGSENTLSKYNTRIDYGTVDNKTVLDPEDDVAHVMWGGNWRMPTKEEQDELRANCTWIWTTENGVNGFRVISNIQGYTDRYIFLPSAGYRFGKQLYHDYESDSDGYYWSSSLNETLPDNVYYLSFDSETNDAGYGRTGRYFGNSVRPVCSSETPSITIDQESVSLQIGETVSLTATVVQGNNNVSYPITWTSDNPSIASVNAEGVVTAHSVGNANITATIQDKSATCIIEVTSASTCPYEYVDLGLSVMWATFNVGASKPEDYGDYFAWGEIEPYYEDGYAQEYWQEHWKSGKTDGYRWSTYKWFNSTSYTMTKYNTVDSYGSVDNKTVLDPDDDVAHIKWGGSWRMPTIAEQIELFTNCTWKWFKYGNTEFGGVAGYKLTSKKEGYSDRFIFLPAAGYRSDEGIYDVDCDGSYWSSSLYTDYPYRAYAISLNSDGVFIHYGDERVYGRSVRPVCSVETDEFAVTIDRESAVLYVGETVSLTATVSKENEIVSYPVDWTSDNPSIASVNTDGVVTAHSVGSATISATVQGKSATCIIEVTIANPDQTDTHKWVDLGLPSGTLWATCNIGADSPEGYGDYFAWGETKPKELYNWSTYQYCNGSKSTLTKYCVDSSYGTVDNKYELDPEDDAATANWGSNWQMPSSAQMEELINSDYTTTEWTTLNGVYGRKITSKINGNSIFLPASGYYSSSIYKTDIDGDYWSRSLYTNQSSTSFFLLFKSDLISNNYIEQRFYGQSIRPVLHSSQILSLSQKEISMEMGDRKTIEIINGSGSYDYEVDNYEIVTVSINKNIVTIMALNPGDATITLTDMQSGMIARITVSVSIAPVAVDLGLSVKWASCNVGAKSQEDAGNYYSWGETETKNEYWWGTYKYCNGSSDKLTKYCNNSEFGNDGYTDRKTILDPEDDIARVKWGGNWRMPTVDEVKDLLNKCTWTWTEQNGVNGYLITSNVEGYEGNSIFIPVTGYRRGNEINNEHYAYYWTSSLYINSPEYAFDLPFGENSHNWNCGYRYAGLAIRPVMSSVELP